jgi:hypothetical protein
MPCYACVCVCVCVCAVARQDSSGAAPISVALGSIGGAAAKMNAEAIKR